MKLHIEWIRSVQVVLLVSLISLPTVVGRAFGQGPFYQGKTITLVRGSTPGGIGEMRLRALIPYLKKHIPGQPAILIEFMDGGGGRKTANHVFGRADGLTIGSTPSGILASAILSEKDGALPSEPDPMTAKAQLSGVNRTPAPNPRSIDVASLTTS